MAVATRGGRPRHSDNPNDPNNPEAAKPLEPLAESDLYPEGDGKPMAESPLHFELMIYVVKSLQARYADQPDVEVLGNQFLYWERGNPKAVVAPDCFVMFGVAKGGRATYKLWEENDVRPSVVIELTSKSTRREDVRKKRPLYETVLGVPEYFLFDPTGDYLRPNLQGYRMREGRYEALTLQDERLYSETLGLELIREGERLRFRDPLTGETYLSPDENRALALREARRADEAEAEIARLRAELERLRQGEREG